MTTSTIETRSSWVVATVSVALLALSFGALWITAVGLKSIAADLGGGRSAPSLANSLAWLGSSVGGIAMGRLADRFGIRWTVMFGAVSICIGLFISTLGEPWQLYVGHGIFMGLLGNAGLNAPLYVYVTRWFDRRRGSALALISSGGYVAGTVWPPIFERTIAFAGWRTTMIVYGLFMVTMIVPLALIFLRKPPERNLGIVAHRGLVQELGRRLGHGRKPGGEGDGAGDAGKDDARHGGVSWQAAAGSSPEPAGRPRRPSTGVRGCSAGPSSGPGTAGPPRTRTGRRSRPRGCLRPGG